MFFAAYRRAIRARKQAEADRDLYRAEVERLTRKLEERTDFFIEREFRMMDRWLTSKAKTFAITDEIRGKLDFEQITDDQVKASAKAAYIEEERQFLIQCAHEAGDPDPMGRAARTIEEQMPRIERDFETSYRSVENN